MQNCSRPPFCTRPTYAIIVILTIEKANKTAMSEWLFLNSNSAYCQLYDGESKYIILFIVDQHP
jgi:hypothetical protein